MSNSLYFELPQSYCIDVSGGDAVAVVNNLCTNDVRGLAEGKACEAFITNLRGWVVAHCCVQRSATGLRLLGSHSSPASICEHIDRYIIREDARIQDRSSEFAIFIMEDSPKAESADLSQLEMLPLPVIPNGVLGIVAADDVDAFHQSLQSSGYRLGNADEFEARRILSFWPLDGREISEKTLPQELDRDRSAISFTKGCYLGQETIARLDARGQLQKKLCLLEFSQGLAEIGQTLRQGDKEVGSLSSVAQLDGKCFGLALLKRGAFATGTELECEGLACQVMQHSPDPV
ncbi:MAG: hypothetical protein NXI32_23745 [bacterium]|nr:hypothetical protein [bacterium]